MIRSHWKTAAEAWEDYTQPNKMARIRTEAEAWRAGIARANRKPHWRKRWVWFGLRRSFLWGPYRTWEGGDEVYAFELWRPFRRGFGRWWLRDRIYLCVQLVMAWPPDERDARLRTEVKLRAEGMEMWRRANPRPSED